MKKDVYELVVLLDGSASMASIDRSLLLKQLQGTLNGFLELADDSLDTNVCVYSVSGAYKALSPHVERRSSDGLLSIEELSELPLPAGSTPYYDRAVHYLNAHQDRYDDRWEVLVELEKQLSSCLKAYEDLAERSQDDVPGEAKKVTGLEGLVAREEKLRSRLLLQHDMGRRCSADLLKALKSRSKRLAKGLSAVLASMGKPVDGMLSLRDQKLQWGFLSLNGEVNEASGLLKLVQAEREVTPFHGVVVNSILDGMDNASLEYGFAPFDASRFGVDGKKKFSAATPSFKNWCHAKGISDLKPLKYSALVDTEEEAQRKKEVKEQKQMEREERKKGKGRKTESNVRPPVGDEDSERAAPQKDANGVSGNVSKKIEVTLKLNPERYKTLLGLSKLVEFRHSGMPRLFEELKAFNRGQVENRKA